MEYVLFDNLTKEEILILENNLKNKEAKTISFDDIDSVQNGEIITVYAGLKLNFISSKLLDVFSNVLVAQKKVQIKLVLIEKFSENLPDFSKYSKIYIVACGSAYHAGLVLKNVY